MKTVEQVRQYAESQEYFKKHGWFAINEWEDGLDFENFDVPEEIKNDLENFYEEPASPEELETDETIQEV